MIAAMNWTPDWLRRRRAATRTADEQTKAVIDAAEALRQKADDVIRAAHALAEERMRERIEGG